MLADADDESERLRHTGARRADNFEGFALFKMHAFARRAENDIAINTRLVPTPDVVAKGAGIHKAFAVEGSRAGQENAAQFFRSEAAAGRVAGLYCAV